MLIDFSFEDMEVMYPKIRLAEDGVAVSIVGAHPAGTKYTGKFGYPVKSDLSDLCIDVRAPAAMSCAQHQYIHDLWYGRMYLPNSLTEY